MDPGPFVRAEGTLGSPEDTAKSDIQPCSSGSSVCHVSFFYPDSHSWPGT